MFLKLCLCAVRVSTKCHPLLNCFITTYDLVIEKIKMLHTSLQTNQSQLAVRIYFINAAGRYNIKRTGLTRKGNRLFK